MYLYSHIFLTHSLIPIHFSPFLFLDVYYILLPQNTIQSIRSEEQQILLPHITLCRLQFLAIKIKKRKNEINDINIRRGTRKIDIT